MQNTELMKVRVKISCPFDLLQSAKKFTNKKIIIVTSLLSPPPPLQAHLPKSCENVGDPTIWLFKTMATATAQLTKG